jgi:crotonobetainyl-CoA:carnitine CoA-transferase CaiB-like acyl-CoA transferase
MATSTGLPAPLDGVRVLDLSRVVAGPLCGRVLADLGAEVVKVEPPGGDATRKLTPFVGGVAAYYAQMNAGKHNVCVDMKTAEGPALVGQLADRADVVVENFRPGVMARLGLDPAALIERNPRLIVCSVSGWGQDGPWRDRKSYAPLVHAETGTIEMAARLRRRPPEQEVHVHGDMYPALLAANAVLAALLQRATTGKGQHLDIAMAEASIYTNDWAAVELQRYEGTPSFDIWTNPVLHVGDGTAVALLGNPVHRFADWIPALTGERSLLADPRFATPAAVEEHLDEALDVLADLVAKHPDVASLEAAMAPMLVGEVRSVADLAETAWADHRGLVTEVTPGLPVPSAPWRSTGAAVGVTPFVSARGADNASVLRRWLQMSDDEVSSLTDRGVLLLEL